MTEAMDEIGSSCDRVREWEEGLPSVGELTPLSQCLISPQLASAFSITSDHPPYRSLADVNLASQSTFATLRRTSSAPSCSIPFAPMTQDAVPAGAFEPKQQHLPALPKVFTTPPNLLRSYAQQGRLPDAKSDGSHEPGEAEGEGEGQGEAFASAAPSSRGTDSSDGATRIEADAELEEAESAPAENPNEDLAARVLKRPRLVWTPELHKRFVEAVAHLGIKNAVPKTIMQLMNVEGLTRENVASHLQKYRLYLKRMQGLSTEGPTSSDHLFASTPIPPSLAASTRFYAGIPAHLEDIMQVPFPTPHGPLSMGRGHVAGTAIAAGPLASMDPFSYNVFARPPPHRFVQGDIMEAHGNKQNQSASSSHHILRLFPSGK